MARPYTSRSPNRPQVSIAPNARPQLDVVAPLNVRTPGPETSPLMGLVQALGIGAEIFGRNKAAKDEYEHSQGVADEQIGEADMERANRSRAYARGAFETLTLEQYQNAEAAVSARAAEELDRSLPIDDQVAIIDGWMKSELGPLVQDDRAKLIFAKRYQKFIDTTAANIQKQQLEANAVAAQDTLMTDMATSIARGAFGPDEWDETFHRLVSQTGDPVGARTAMVATIGQAMVNAAAMGEDPEPFRSLIPTEVTGPDGAKLPSPMKSPAVQGAVNEYMAQARRAYDTFWKQKYAGEQFEALNTLKLMIEDGQEITEATFAAKGYTVGDGAKYTFTPIQASNLMERSRAERARRVTQEATYNSYMAAYQRTGRLASTLYAPGGPDSPEKLADFADAVYQQTLQGLGVPPEEMAGGALVANAGAVQTLAQLTSENGVPYRPLKNELNSVNPASPGDVTARLDAYNQLKRYNLTGMYVDDDTAVIYEVANGAIAAGAEPEVVQQRIRDMADKDTSMYVRNNSSDIEKKMKSGVRIKTGNWFRNTEVNSNSTGNPAYVNGTYRSLVLQGLAAQMRPEEADKFAKDRMNATHTAIEVGDTYFVLPNASIPDNQEATEALNWYNSRLPELSKKWGIPEDEGLVIKPTIAFGRRPYFQVYRADGAVAIAKTEFTLAGVINSWKHTADIETGQDRAIQRRDDRARLRERATPEFRAEHSLIPGLR